MWRCEGRGSSSSTERKEQRDGKNLGFKLIGRNIDEDSTKEKCEKREILKQNKRENARTREEPGSGEKFVK